MDHLGVAYVGSSSDTEMMDGPVSNTTPASQSCVTSMADFKNQTPGQSLALATFERLSDDILRLAREMGMDSRQINFTRVQQEQLRLLFVKANKTIDASDNYVKCVENHRNYAQYYSVQLEDAAEKYDFLSSDYRRNKADLETVKVKIEQLDSKVTNEMEAMKREIKELRELVKARVV